MSAISFTYLNKAEKDKWLPALFDILWENMRIIAPGGLAYEQEKALWLSNVSPALDKAPRKIILCHVGNDLAGYLQYYIRDRMLMIEEIQLKKEYQRTGLFGRFCAHLIAELPDDLQTVEAYAERRNLNSRRIMEKLGMEHLEEDPGSPFVHLRGHAAQIRRFFR